MAKMSEENCEKIKNSAIPSTTLQVGSAVKLPANNAAEQ